MYRKWTTAEDTYIKSNLTLSPPTLALHLNRSEGAIRSRLRKMPQHEYYQFKLSSTPLSYFESSDGYIRVKTKHHIFFDHRFCWMCQYDEPIPEGYTIHHIDGNKAYNEIWNIVALHSKDHINLHTYPDWYSFFEGKTVKLLPEGSIPSWDTIKETVRINGITPTLSSLHL